MTRRLGLLWAVTAFSAAALSLWLAAGRRMQFLDATFDDQLFARLANSLRDGMWLGAYDKFTLAKGPGYPAFLALVSAAGIPLRLAEQAVYLLGCWLICRMAARLSGRPWIGAAAFAIAALNPVLWGASLARIARENLYIGLTALVLGLAMYALLPRCTAGAPATRQPDSVPARLGWGALLGLAFGWFWLTREEGLWLVPALGVLAVDWMVRRWRARPAAMRGRHHAATLAVLLAPCASFAAVDLGVAAINYRAYGVFETNEFRSAEFKAAYGALSRIKHDQWQRYIPVPHDARLRAYQASAAARELAPSLEGVNGKSWQAQGCSVLPIQPCNDVQSGWFMWALRDAAEAAGHTGSAVEARDFYARLAAEINLACERGAIPCEAARTGFVPPWRPDYLPFVLRDAWELAKLLARLGDQGPAYPRSDDAPAAVRTFRRVALGPWTPAVGSRRDLRPNDVHLLGWAYASSGPLQVRILNGGRAMKSDFTTYDSPDMATLLTAGSGEAVRFAGDVLCGDDPCQIVVQGAGQTVQRDLLTLKAGFAVHTGPLRLFLDEVEPLPRVTPAGLPASHAIAAAIFNALRGASGVLLPVALALAVILAAQDLLKGSVRPLTVLWLALLATMGLRVGLLAVLNATSLPAISPLYLSPAVGIGMLFTTVVILDAACRVATRLRPPGRTGPTRRIPASSQPAT